MTEIARSVTAANTHFADMHAPTPTRALLGAPAPERTSALTPARATVSTPARSTTRTHTVTDIHAFLEPRPTAIAHADIDPHATASVHASLEPRPIASAHAVGEPRAIHVAANGDVITRANAIIGDATALVYAATDSFAAAHTTEALDANTTTRAHANVDATRPARTNVYATRPVHLDLAENSKIREHEDAADDVSDYADIRHTRFEEIAFQRTQGAFKAAQRHYLRGEDIVSIGRRYEAKFRDRIVAVDTAPDESFSTAELEKNRRSVQKAIGALEFVKNGEVMKYSLAEIAEQCSALSVPRAVLELRLQHIIDRQSLGHAGLAAKHSFQLRKQAHEITQKLNNHRPTDWYNPDVANIKAYGSKWIKERSETDRGYALVEQAALQRAEFIYATLRPVPEASQPKLADRHALLERMCSAVDQLEPETATIFMEWYVRQAHRCRRPAEYVASMRAALRGLADAQTRSIALHALHEYAVAFNVIPTRAQSAAASSNGLSSFFYRGTDTRAAGPRERRSVTAQAESRASSRGGIGAWLARLPGNLIGAVSARLADDIEAARSAAAADAPGVLRIEYAVARSGDL